MIKLYAERDGSAQVRTSKGSYYLPNNLYVACNFDIKRLPIKLNLPMVCKPRDWSATKPDEKPKTLSDLAGGYLSGPTGEIYDRYRLLSSGDLHNFYIDIRQNNAEDLCCVMNALQSQAFQINSDCLKYIQDNEESLVDNGLLTPGFLASKRHKDVSGILREF